MISLVHLDAKTTKQGNKEITIKIKMAASRKEGYNWEVLGGFC